MAFTQLRLNRFRNHPDSQFLAPGRFNLLFGENGAGKTNVLEALSLFAPGRGLRRAALSQMILAPENGDGTGGFGIFARLGDVDIGTGVEAHAPERRQVRINGANHAANALAEWVSLVWLTPAMDGLFNDAAGARRRFLDRLVLAVQPGHAHIATRYEVAVRERNRLLAGERTPDAAWLDALEGRMAEYGAALDAARHDLVQRLNTAMDNADTGVFAKPLLALSSDAPTGCGELAAIWRKSRARDRAAGRTLSGPHRDDLRVTLRQKRQDAALSSTGEQKALLIAIILAHAGLVQDLTGRAPVLLLDEVAAHLDPARRQSLYDQLAARAGQYWLTGTDAALFSGIAADAQYYEIRDGVVVEQG